MMADAISYFDHPHAIFSVFFLERNGGLDKCDGNTEVTYQAGFVTAC